LGVGFVTFTLQIIDSLFNFINTFENYNNNKHKLGNEVSSNRNRVSQIEIEFLKSKSNLFELSRGTSKSNFWTVPMTRTLVPPHFSAIHGQNCWVDFEPLTP
jgi:hypothetical protein